MTVGTLESLHLLATEYEEDEGDEKKQEKLFSALLHLLWQGPATGFELLRFIPFGDEVMEEQEAVYRFLTFLKCKGSAVTPGSECYEEVVKTVQGIPPLELCSLVWGLSRATMLRIEPAELDQHNQSG